MNIKTGGDMGLTEEQQKVMVKEILKSSTTWNGGDLSDHFHEEHEVTMSKITIGPKERLPIHSHPVMSVSYVLKGELTVISDMGEEKLFHSGQAFLGLINQDHYGMNNTSGEVEILAVYLGEKGRSVTVFADNSALT